MVQNRPHALEKSPKKKRGLYEICDPALYEELQRIRRNPQLDIEMVQKANILPRGTRFYHAPVPAWHGRVKSRQEQQERWKQRDAWHTLGRKELQSADLVFTDPDNGIIFSERKDPKTRKPSHKHSYWYELHSYLKTGKSLVAYHHLGRQKGGHAQEIGRCLRIILDRGYQAWAVHYRRGTSRAFLIIPACKGHQAWLRQATETFTDSMWRAHATLVDLGAGVGTPLRE